jgi:hypothetical protein
MRTRESLAPLHLRILCVVHSLAPGPDSALNLPHSFLYTDERGWHLIYHVYNTHENPPHGHECVNSTVSAHAFSENGFEWHMSPLSPYGTQVQLTSGETVTVATRERPKLWFNSKGQKTHLFNGVCSAENCPAGPASGCVDCKCELNHPSHHRPPCLPSLPPSCSAHSPWRLLHRAAADADWDYTLVQPLDV